MDPSLVLAGCDHECYKPYIHCITRFVLSNTKCGFMLAEEQKTWGNIFLTHCWEREYKYMGGFRPLGLCKVQFLFRHPPLTDMPHSPKFKPQRSAQYPEEICLKDQLRGSHFETVLAARPHSCDIIWSDLKLAARRKTLN